MPLNKQTKPNQNLNSSDTNLSIMDKIPLRDISKSKVGDHSRGWPEGSLFVSYYTKV